MEKEIAILLAKLQGIAQTGKFYGKDIFDQERYEELGEVTKELTKIIYPSLGEEELAILVDADEGYATPKVDIRAVIFNEENQLLLVKEKSDGCWSLPGGWGDIGYSPKEIAEKETLEEAGIQVKAQKLLAVLDKSKHDYPPSLTYVYKLFIHCTPLSSQLQSGVETSEVAYFSLEEILTLPLSKERNIPENFIMLFERHQNKDIIVLCD